MIQKDLIFEAWLRNGVVVKEDGRFKVLSFDEANARLKDLIENGKFEEAAVIAEQLKNQHYFSDKVKRTSIRVPFVTYLKVAEKALRNKVSISKLVESLLIKDIARVLDNLSNKKDFNAKKIAQLRHVLSGFLKAQKTPRSAADYLRSYAARGAYRLSLDFPESWREIALEAVEEMREDFIDNYRSEIDEEILRKYLEITYQESIFEINILNDEKPFITLENGELILEFGIHSFPHVSDEMTKEKMIEEEGYETMKKFEEVIGEGTLEGDAIPPQSYEKIFYKVAVKIEGSKILFSPRHPIENPSFFELEDLKLMIEETYEKEVKALKEDTLKLLENKKFKNVAEKTKQLSRLNKDKKRIDFTFIILSKLFSRSQVITFSLPECLLYTWQTYGTKDIDQLLRKYN